MKGAEELQNGQRSKIRRLIDRTDTPSTASTNKIREVTAEAESSCLWSQNIRSDVTYQVG